MKTPVEKILDLLNGQGNRQLRILRGPYSQTELAAILQVQPSSVNDWEAGAVLPQPRYIRALLDHAFLWTKKLDLDLPDLLDLATANEKEKTS